MENMYSASIITGGGRGIGKAIARRLSDTTNVVIVGRTRSDLEDTCNEINEKEKGQAVYVVGDVGHLQTAQETISEIKKNDWDLNNVICNAGIAKSGALHAFDEHLWQEMLHVNIMGAFNFSKVSLPLLLERGKGTICLMSSIAGLEGYAYESAYCASKHALVGLAKSMVLEYGKKGITVAALCPGFVESDMTTRTINGVMKRRGISYDEARERIASKNVHKRIIPAEEIAEIISAICEGKISSISGKPLILSSELEVMAGKNYLLEPNKLDELVSWIKENAVNANALLVPISGGSDSALSFYLCATAYPQKTVGVFAGRPSELREKDWFERNGKVEYTEVSGTYEDRESIRWAKLNALSIQKKAWLVGSRNKTEDLLGTYSLASRIATVLPLVGVWKSEVLKLCEKAGVPSSIVASSLRADPECGRPEELSAISYGKIELFLKEKIGISGNFGNVTLNPQERTYLEGIYNYNQFKKGLPIQKR